MIKIRRGVLSSLKKLRVWLIGNTNGNLYTSTDSVTWVTNTLIPVGNFIDNVNTGATWTSKTSTFGTTHIYSIAYGNGIWVAGGYGLIRTSTDTITWATQTSVFGVDGFSSAYYGNGMWVAVGKEGKIFTSTDGIAWVQRTSNFGTGVLSFIFCVSYGNGIWVAGGYGQIRTSTDTVIWTTRNSTFGATAIRSVVYGNGIWIAVGDSAQLRTSTDTITWITQTSTFGTSQILSIAYGNGSWVAAGRYGQLRSSGDGSFWVTRTSNFGVSRIWSISYGNNLWVAAGDGGKLSTSTDTISWTTRSSGFTVNIKSVFYGNGMWTAGGYVGNLRTSPQIYKPSTSSIQDLEYNPYSYDPNSTNAVFWLAGTGGALYNSTDAIFWTTNNSPTTFNNRHINAIKYAVDNGQGNLSWTTVANTSGFTPAFGYFANNVWVFGGTVGNTFRATTDLISWVTIGTNYGTSTVTTAFYNNGTWVFGGSGGQISTATTTDNISWSVTPRTSNAVYSINAIAYGNSTWVAALSLTGVRYSTNNGATWATSTLTGVGILNTAKSVSYINGSFYAVGQTSSNSIGPIATSTDAITWTTVYSTYKTNVIWSIAYGNGIWMVGGSGANIQYSKDNFITWVTSPISKNSGASIYKIIYTDNVFYFVTSDNYIYASTDAISWATTYNNAGGFLATGFDNPSNSNSLISFDISGGFIRKNFNKSYMIGLNNNG
jgi:hypothetical protein